VTLHLKIRVEGPAVPNGAAVISEAVEVSDESHARKFVEGVYFRDEDSLQEVVSAVLCVEEVRLV